MIFCSKIILVTLAFGLIISAITNPFIRLIPNPPIIPKIIPIIPFKCLQQQYLQSLSDFDLFTEGLKLHVGKCAIISGMGNNRLACDYYAQVLGQSALKNGLPDLIGTGCIKSPTLPKHVGICWGPPNTYKNYESLICTNDYIKNAANMIRIGINKHHCGLLCDCSRKYTLLMMSDLDLFNAALNKNVGKCVIISGMGNNRLACDYYAQVLGQSALKNGLPDLIGTGCIKSPTLPKHMSICWGPPNTYKNYESLICTNDYIKNAANMIRIGLKKDHCGVC